MTFAQYEASRQAGRPITLYFFRYGASPNSYVAHTDHDENVMYDAGDGEGTITYAPIGIVRGRIKINGTMRKETLDVEMPVSSALNTLFRDFPPASVVRLTVRDLHLDDPAQQSFVAWVGRIIASSIEDNVLKLQSESDASSLKKPGLRRHWQLGCPHILYGDRCLASKAAGTVNTTVDAITANIVTLPAAWFGAFDPTKFLQGQAEWTNAAGDLERRTIWEVLGANLQLRLSAPARDLAVSDPITVILGCAHNTDDCENLHNNIRNYGGMPFIPLENPVNDISFYY